MTTVQLQLPESVARLIPKVGEKVLLQAIRESVQRLISEEREELKSVKTRIGAFEQKYEKSFEAFEKEMPADGDYKSHEDYGEWSFLEERANMLEQDIADYEQLYGTI